jgi:hypothetical protein
MPSTRTLKLGRRLSLGAVVAIGACLAVMGACGNAANNPDVLGNNPGSDSSVGTGTCSIGKEGCACSTPGQSVSCGDIIENYGSYVTCQEGTTTCENGSWGACKGNTIVQRSTRGTTLSKSSPDGFSPLGQTLVCPNPCDPNTCTQTTDGSGDVPDGAPVLITDAGVSLVPTTTTGGGGNGDGGACSGLQCQVDWSCATNSRTTLTGTVYDPVMQNPLYNAYVYIPVDPNPADLPAFSSGASCDSCAGVSLNAVAVAITDVNGHFTLTNVPTTAKAPNSPIPLVVQMGKWRRVQMLTTVADCKSTAVPVASSRLPRNMFDGYNNHADIPRMALASGSADPFECMMLKMGIDPAEFQVPGSGSRRIDFYQANGLQYQGGIAPAYSQLVGATSAMTPYDVVLLPCEGKEDDGNNNYADYVAAYTLAGGRVFTTHYGYTWLSTPTNGTAHATNPVTGNPNIFYPVATWNLSHASYNSAGGQIDTNFPKGATFETWMDQLPAPNVGAVTTGDFTIDSPRYDVTSVNTAYATEWIHHDASPHETYHFTFNTPLGAGVGDAGADGGAAVCGRVVYSDFHVSTADIIGGNGSCTSNSQCGYGSTCSGSSGTVGTCTTQSCDPDQSTSSTCGDSAFTCTGGTAGTCGCYRNSDCSSMGAGTCSGGSLGSCSATTCGVGSDCSTGTCNGATLGKCGCYQNSDCSSMGAGTCSGGTIGQCVMNGTCSHGYQCASGNCSGGVCKNEPTCTSSGGCGSKEKCSGLTAGTCTTATCGTNGNCSAGNGVCNGGSSGYCACGTSNDCNNWWESCNGVTAGICTGATCYANADCSSGSGVCSGTTSQGTCGAQNCTTTSQCNSTGYSGHEQCIGGTCKGCLTSNDCPGPTSQCVGGAPANTCTGNNTQFPSACSQGPLNAQESALEFMLLDLTACVSPDNAPPPGPPTPVISYNPATFTVNFASSCPSGTHVRWTELDWQATVPSTASIVFQGQTANPAADGGAPNYSSAQTVQIADATTTTPGLPAGWNAALIDVSPVDAGAGGAFNTASPAVQSQNDLLLTITLNPTTDKTQAPTLIQWQVKSDCPPSE